MNLPIDVSKLYKKPKGKTYFLSHSVGLMPISTEQIIRTAFLDNWHQGGDNIWPLWLESIDRFKAALGRLFNANSDGFCPQTNVSSGLTKVINALPSRHDKQTILISEHDFPSTTFVVEKMAKLGYQVKRIPKHLNHQDVNVWDEYISPDVGCVFITHVHYNTNQLIPVGDISKAAREKGVIAIVDIAQSAGIVPIDIPAWDVDVVLGSCIKWLCGGPGAGFMWVNPTLIASLEPTDVGWFSHENPFEFDAYRFEYAKDSTRFWGGTPSILPYIVAANSIEQQIDIGIVDIRRYNQALCCEVMNHIDEKHLVSPVDTEKKGGTLVLKFDNQEGVVEKLTTAGILFDAREQGIRISPHLYNDEEDIKRLINCF